MSIFPSLSDFSDKELLWVMMYEFGKQRPDWSHGHFLSAQHELLQRYPRDSIMGAWVASNQPHQAYFWLDRENAA